MRILSSSATSLFLAFLCSGCASSRLLTVVEGSLEPRNFRFVTIVEQRGEEPGGWRAACLRLPIRSDTGEEILCKMGVEMPIRTEEDGLLSLLLAQRVAANCGNSAAQVAFGATTLETPLGIACENFKKAFNLTLNTAIVGSRVKTACHPKSESAQIGR